MHDTGLFPGNDLLQLAQNGFLTEADNLAQIAQSPDFTRLLGYFENYQEFLSTGRHEYFNNRFFEALSTDQVIDITGDSEDFIRLKHAINFAAACDLFAGWSLSTDSLKITKLRDQVKQSIRDLGGSQNHAGEILARKLNSGDASRVIHMLKIFGWVASDMTHSQQLSLGASGGTRDRYSIHQIPAPRYQRPNPLLREPTPEMVSFDVSRQTANNIVLVDNDPKMQHRYEKLNEEPNILALNLDGNHALDELKKRIANSEVEPRTFVLAFRIDHRMIPDSNEFLCRLGSVIDDAADLVVTIGAGHNVNEFKGRREKISELFTSLTQHDLKPVIIRWHSGKTLSAQRKNPVFGSPTYATYEILYCKLSKSAFSA